VSLEELYNGVTQSFNVNRNVYCSGCRGTGAEGGETKECPTCKGRGVVMQMVNMGIAQMQMQQPCNKCAGKGRTAAKHCKSCRGRRLVQEGKQFTVDIEKGMKNGDKITFEKDGEQQIDMIQGDIIFIIKQQTHAVFKRVGDNLYMNLDITLEEALLGFKKTIKHMDGHTVEIKSDPMEVIQPFSWKILKDEGMPIRNSGGDYGELHVKMIVGFPAELTAR
jgi:DnaJ-class molecular chaperone